MEKKELEELKLINNKEKQHFEREFASVFSVLDRVNKLERIKERKKDHSPTGSPSRLFGGTSSVEGYSPGKTNKTKDKKNTHVEAQNNLESKKKEVQEFEEIF